MSLCSVWCTPLWLGPQQLACGSGTQPELYLSQYGHLLSDLENILGGEEALWHTGKIRHMTKASYITDICNETVPVTSDLGPLCHYTCIIQLLKKFCFMEVPANAMQTCSSRAHILRTVLSSCNFATDFFSTPRTTMSFPLIPTCTEKIFN